MLDSLVWSVLLIFGQYLTCYSCLLFIRSHILCMKYSKDNLKFWMILSLFPVYPFSWGKALQNPSWTPGMFVRALSAWLGLSSSPLPKPLSSVGLPGALCSSDSQSLHSSNFSVSLLSIQMSQKEKQCQVWIQITGFPCLLDL